MFAMPPALQVLVHDVLAERVGLKVRALLDHRKLADDLFAPRRKGHAQARRDGLGEGAEVNDVLCRCPGNRA